MVLQVMPDVWQVVSGTAYGSTERTRGQMVAADRFSGLPNRAEKP